VRNSTPLMTQGLYLKGNWLGWKLAASMSASTHI
jgi:hypothetical protein